MISDPVALVFVVLLYLALGATSAHLASILLMDEPNDVVRRLVPILSFFLWPLMWAVFLAAALYSRWINS